MDVKFYLVTVIILFISAVDIRGVDAEENFVFGDCEPGKESCRDCYLTLVKSLFENGTNVFNLMNVFLPPNNNPPDSVIVTYQFYNETMDIKKLWFWATTFGYFLHPLAHFQYMSLLFGKPEPLHQQSVNVTLNATECYGVDDDFMLLLTQRLKVYLQEQSITAHVDDSYAASAVNKAIFNKTIKRYGNDRNYNSVVFSLVYPVIIPIFLIGIIVPLITLYVCTHKHKFMYTSGRLQRTRFRKLHRQVRTGIISLAIISFTWLLGIIGMDIASIYYTHNSLGRFDFSNETHNIFKEIHPGPGDEDDFNRYHRILYHLPHILFVYDGLFSVAYIAIIVVAIVTHICQDDKQQTEHDDRIYHILALTVICPILSLLTHLPFIAIAYLNDANHAGSIFIFFAIVTIVEFLILELSFISFFKLLKNISQVSKTNRWIKSFLVVLVVVVCLFFFFFLLAISVCYFYYLPIVQSISRSSNQVIAIYQTILIFIGALILYKTIFKKTDPLVKALNQKEVGNMISKSATEEWEASNDRDKLISFYSFLIMDVIKNLSKVPTVSRGWIDTNGIPT